MPWVGKDVKSHGLRYSYFMTLDERLKTLLDPLGAESKRMFGGTCFMINGNMVIGTFRDGILVRVGKDGHAAALKLPGAATFEMQGRTMQGYVLVGAKSITRDAFSCIPPMKIAADRTSSWN